MTGSVLCAVDVSSNDEDVAVLKLAARLAALDNRGLDVITVIPDFGLSSVASFFDEGHSAKAAQEAKSALNALVETALGKDENTKVRHIVAVGKAYEEVLKTAQKAGTDLIVVGAHKADFKDYLLGPNAARIVRHSKCSVYVVR